MGLKSGRVTTSLEGDIGSFPQGSSGDSAGYLRDKKLKYVSVFSQGDPMGPKRMPDPGISSSWCT